MEDQIQHWWKELVTLGSFVLFLCILLILCPLHI